MPYPIRRQACHLCLAVLLPLLSACTLVQLRQEATAFEASTVLVGRIDCADTATPLVVAAVAVDRPQPAVVHHTPLHECGGYELLVPAGRHRVLAFADLDRNGRFDAGEALAEHPATIDAPDTGLVMGIDLRLGPPDATAAARAAQLGLDGLPPRGHSTQAGAVLPLDDAALTPEQGNLGYWAPMSFFARHGGNVYFLEPYDPQRTPVLFVHGAAGSAQDFRSLIGRLDRRRYQAWVFHYPSGASLSSMAHLLYWKLLNLQLRHRFTQLAVVAHSMGGLVVRQQLDLLGAELASPALFVSISTPWGGEPGAELGVRHSPAVVPSWYDMQPEGPFLGGLFKRPLPAGCEQVLLFGHRGGPSLVRPNNDGTVTLASQLRPEAQAQASRVLGFDEDHMSILASPQVAQLLGDLLDRHWPRGASPPPGQVRVALSAEAELPRGLAMLRLRPADGGAAPLWLLLSGNDDRRPLGPVPPGRYEASLLVPGQTAAPARQAVELRPGETPTLAFALRADGQISGYVVDARGGGRPAPGARSLPQQAIPLRAVTLSGNGLHRRLLPRAVATVDDALEAQIDGQDVTAAGLFNFSGLPPGDYELLIEADGYQPHRSRHVVRPGLAAPTVPLRLQPVQAM